MSPFQVGEWEKQIHLMCEGITERHPFQDPLLGKKCMGSISAAPPTSILTTWECAGVRNCIALCKNLKYLQPLPNLPPLRQLFLPHPGKYIFIISSTSPEYSHKLSRRRCQWITLFNSSSLGHLHLMEAIRVVLCTSFIYFNCVISKYFSMCFVSSRTFYYLITVHFTKSENSALLVLYYYILLTPNSKFACCHKKNVLYKLFST